jgi:outer membrane protein assembly factor BamB
MCHGVDGSLQNPRYYSGVHVRVGATSWALAVWRRRVWGVSLATGLLLAPAGAAAQVPDAASVFPLVTAWSVEVGAPASTNLATDGSAVYLGTRAGQVVAVSLRDGHLRWSVPLDTAITPAVDGERVFVSTADAIDARSAAAGERVWHTPLPASPVVRPAAHAGWLLVPLDTGELLALNGTTGAQVWRRSLGATLSVTPEVLGEHVYCATSDGRVVALDIRDGSLAWDRQIGGRIRGLLVTGERVYAGSDDNFFYVLALADGRQAWRWRAGGTIIGVPALDERHIYIVSLDNLMRALDRRNGSQRWRTALAFRPITGPLRIGDTLVAAGRSPELRGYAAANGRPAGQQALGNEIAAPPVIVPGPLPGHELLLVLYGDGRLQALARRLVPDLAPLDQLPGVPLGPIDAPPRPAGPGAAALRVLP